MDYVNDMDIQHLLKKKKTVKVKVRKRKWKSAIWFDTCGEKWTLTRRRSWHDRCRRPHKLVGDTISLRRHETMRPGIGHIYICLSLCGVYTGAVLLKIQHSVCVCVTLTWCIYIYLCNCICMSSTQRQGQPNILEWVKEREMK